MRSLCVFWLQLDLIVDLLGSPSDDDIRTACEPAKAYVRSKGHLSSKIAALYQLSPDCDDFIMHLMCQMLTFNPVFTISLMITVLFTVAVKHG